MVEKDILLESMNKLPERRQNGCKIIQINTVCNTSTGRIMGDIQKAAIKQGYLTLSFVGRRKPFKDIPCERFGTGISFWIHVLFNTFFDRQGFASYFVTKRLIKRLKEERPDIIHLHNLHGYYLNLPLLFRYLKNDFQGRLFWTFHDCWPFTGHCAYFTMAGCNKWETGCYRCPNKTVYPISLFMDASSKNYKDKKKLFGGLKNLTIITPSCWMADLVKQSFMKDYPLEVVSNGIDLSAFKYEIDEKLYIKYKIPREKKIILGVANIWEKRKGLEDFLELSTKLSDDFRIVLVGLSERQIKMLPPKIIGIERTEDKKELSGIYSLAEILMNPSQEESFSLVTVEALACGTPVIGLDTSAVKELICQDNGIVLSRHRTIDYLNAIKELENKKLSREAVRKTSQKYSENNTTRRILELYEKT